MAESLLQNEHPLNQKALKLLLKEKVQPNPELLYLAQLLIVGLNGALSDPLVERLHGLSPRLVMKGLNLDLDDLKEVSPYQASLLIAEAMELDVDALDL